jgi:uncharacterized protein
MDLFVSQDVLPKEELRFAFVREQGFDRSCGYAAAASLLSLYWRLDLDEASLVGRYGRDKLASGQLEVSFADLARIFRDYGFEVKSVKLNWSQLGAALGDYAPIVIHYLRPDRHFALALWASEDWIVTLDPALGCEILGRAQFLERWSGAAMLAFSELSKRDEALLGKAIRVAQDRRELLERLATR